MPDSKPTSTHWGHSRVTTDKGAISEVLPNRFDTNPSPIAQSLIDAQHSGCRVPTPHIRRGYLESPHGSDGSKRGADPFVAVPWDEALDIAAQALQRTIDQHGNQAIYGGSYGWSSAGRFHHAQSQMRRFLNQIGGCTYSVQNYSFATAQVILPRIIGMDATAIMLQAPTIEDICQHTRLMVCFGGISMKNTQINQGGLANHGAEADLKQVKNAGVDIVSVSPVRDDVAGFLDAEWLPIRPNADTALMMALAHTLFTENRHDQAFIDRYTSGFHKFVPYLVGESDGIAKDAAWAAQICDIDAEQIRQLARRMASEPCLLSISWSLQRTEHGDQPYWMITVLGAMLGRIGLPGQGVGYGYGCIHNFGFVGRKRLSFKFGALPQGKNPIDQYIPVARVSDMLLHPGEPFVFDGETLNYPDIKLVYWCGGNPFHHHQDINRLKRAFSQPETIVVNEPFWTATARHADIVFPATVPLERDDYASGTADLYVSPMHRAIAPYANSRDDYSIFSGLAERMGVADSFTEQRSAEQWLHHLWQVSVDNAHAEGVHLPAFEEFWQSDVFQINPDEVEPPEFDFEAFRRDPDTNPLDTPSGKIEIFSVPIDSFQLPDCAGHPKWFDKTEFIGSERSKQFPLALNSNQPVTKLHSQYDFGRTSVNAKVNGRECIRINPVDAVARGIADGDVVRVYNDRGATLASAVLTDSVRQSVVVLPTGAWYDPLDAADSSSLDVHGNPNVLTRDQGSSQLAQGTSAHSTLVEVEVYREPLPPIKVFDQPPTMPRND
jgi:biotin/methionine sulfoxide reductase